MQWVNRQFEHLQSHDPNQRANAGRAKYHWGDSFFPFQAQLGKSPSVFDDAIITQLVLITTGRFNTQTRQQVFANECVGGSSINQCLYTNELRAVYGRHLERNGKRSHVSGLTS